MAGERGRARLSQPPSAPLMPIERELFLRSIGERPRSPAWPSSSRAP